MDKLSDNIRSSKLEVKKEKNRTEQNTIYSLIYQYDLHCLLFLNCMLMNISKGNVVKNRNLKGYDSRTIPMLMPFLLL